MAPVIDLEIQPVGRSGSAKVRVIAKVGGEPVHMDSISLDSSVSRERFLKAIKKKVPDIDAKALEAELVRYAGQCISPSPATGSDTKGERSDEATSTTKAVKQAKQRPPTIRGERLAITNYETRTSENDKGKMEKRDFVLPARHIVSRFLEQHGHLFVRVGDTLYQVVGSRIVLVPDNPTLFGLIAEIGVICWQGGCDKDGNNFLTRAEFLALLRIHVREYAAITRYPLYPSREDVYVACTEADDYDPDGTMLAQFIGYFNPAADVDRSLLYAYILTLFWGGEPGHRPLFVVGPAEDHGRQQCIGKSETVRQPARLVGGAIEVCLAAKGDYADDLSKQVLDPINIDRRAAVLDNTTGTLRDDKLADLITCREIEGRASHARRSRRPNLITWAITTNELSFSADLASRAVVIRLNPCDREARPDWLEEVGVFIQEHGLKVAADSVYLLEEGERHKIEHRHSRFPSWDRQVLAVLPNVNDVLAYIEASSRRINADVAETDELLRLLPRERPDGGEFRMRELADLWEQAHGRRLDVSVVGRLLRSARNRGSLPGLHPKNRKNGSPWVWEPHVLADEEGWEG